MRMRQDFPTEGLKATLERVLGSPLASVRHEIAEVVDAVNAFGG